MIIIPFFLFTEKIDFVECQLLSLIKPFNQPCICYFTQEHDGKKTGIKWEICDRQQDWKKELDFVEQKKILSFYSNVPHYYKKCYFLAGPGGSRLIIVTPSVNHSPVNTEMDRGVYSVVPCCTVNSNNTPRVFKE